MFGLTSSSSSSAPAASHPMVVNDAVSGLTVFGSRIDPKAATLVTVNEGTPAFDAIMSYPALHTVKEAKGTSFSLRKNSQLTKGDDDDDDDDEETITMTTEETSGETKETKKQKRSPIALSPGIGVHSTTWEGKEIHVAVQVMGPPVGTNCGVTLYKFVTVATAGKRMQEFLHRFMDHVIEVSNTCTDTKTIQVYSWHSRYKYWRSEQRQVKRPVSTIVLDSNRMEMIIQDIKDFQRAKKWYYQHGIPYKRCIMLYGPPGTGKSSTIRALASHFDRALCFLQPSDEHCNDESFKKAMETAPKNSLIAIEDIDALFSKDRKSLNSRCPLTFSGLLNGIDGIGAPNGQLVLMTTNYMDRLDPALVRAGRCDLQVELKHATPVQIKAMFLRFYSGEVKEAERFTEKLKEVTSLSMAALQNHFIIHRKSTAAECVDGLCIVNGRLLILAKGASPPGKEDVQVIAKEEDESKKEKKDPLPEKVSDWKNKDVVQWAEKNELLNPNIADFLKRQNLDGEMILTYDNAMMVEDGLKVRGNRIRLVRALKELSESARSQ